MAVKTTKTGVSHRTRKPLTIGQRRLLTLAKHLEDKVEPSNFILDGWRCGTKACAVGHAATISSFKKAGLSLCGDPALSRKDGCMLNGWGVVEEFFGLNYDEAMTLFGRDSEGATPKKMARQLRAFVEGGLAAVKKLWGDK